MTHAPGDGERLYVVEKRGRIQLIKSGGAVSEFLDITNLVRFNPDPNSEYGFLGLAFHPDYVTNGRFWVHYSRDTNLGQCGGNTSCNHENAIQEFRRDANNADLADPTPVGPPVLTIGQPYSNHNGGHIEFGPHDGLLYIGIGDGGSANDPHSNGVNKDSLLAKLLRIDVSPTDGTYAIPAGNISDGAPEIFDWGLRNPYRFGFDVCTGDRYIGDVGQGQWEEVDVAPPSQGPTNWGWDCFEGNHDFGLSAAGCPFGDEVAPAWEYPHPTGLSITGGTVYRGHSIPWLRGSYVVADFATGQLWRFRWENGPIDPQTVVSFGNGAIAPAGFGLDDAGEIYVAGYNTGEVYRIDEQ
ncbi:MAG: PQQ-dependent sugar dehydrogenase [Polyangiaceae bacterium]